MIHEYVTRCPSCEAEDAMVWEVEPYRPAKIVGPPEDCYPEEGGWAAGECSECGYRPTREECVLAYEQWERTAMDNWYPDD